ncbi:MAG: hypothetical protein OEV62_00030 [Actinomycetota bacterium]|nr:hypothetical protein [Actinomycetota bacterium]
MAFTQRDLESTRVLAGEVARLCAEMLDSGERLPPICGSALSGQLRRRSMDLTRQLARLRAS